MSITHTITAIEAKVSLGLEALDLAAHFGGTWGEHPQHEVGDWAEEVALESTRLGYWEWVANRIDSGDFDLDDDDLDDDDTDDGATEAPLLRVQQRSPEADDQAGNVAALLKAGFDEMFE